MGNNIGAMRTQERTALRDGKIDKKEAEDLAAAAAKTNTKEDWAALRDMFAHDRLDSSVNVDKVLGKANANKAETRQSAVQSEPLGKGVDIYGKPVDAKIARTIGNVDGYKTKYEALAAARLGGAVNGVVVEKNGRFYAGEANVAVTSPKGSSGITAVAPLDMGEYARVQADKTLSVDDKNKKLAAMAFGVPESDIKVVHAASEREAGKINVDSSLPADKNGQTTKDKAAADPVDGTKVAVAISPRLLDDPARAATTLFHEGTHAGDWQTANDVVAKFPKGFDPKRDAKKANELVEKWPGLTKSGRTAVREYLGIAGGGDQTTEARGYAKALGAALEKDPGGVRDQLIGFAAEIKDLAGKDVANSATFKELAAELKKKLATLPDDKRKVFDDAAAAIAKGHPEFVKALDDAGLTSKRVSRP